MIRLLITFSIFFASNVYAANYLCRYQCGSVGSKICEEKYEKIDGEWRTWVFGFYEGKGKKINSHESKKYLSLHSGGAMDEAAVVKATLINKETGQFIVTRTSLFESRDSRLNDYSEVMRYEGFCEKYKRNN